MQSQLEEYLQSIPGEIILKARQQLNQAIRSRVGYVGRVSPFPYILSARDERRIAKATKTLLSLIVNLPKRIFENDWLSFSEFLQLDPRDIERYGFSLDAPYLDSMARPDIYLYKDGLKFLEVNMDSSLGGIDLVDRINRCLEDSALLSPFWEEHSSLTLSNTMEAYEGLLISTLQKHYGSNFEKKVGLWELKECFEKYSPSYSAHIKETLEAKGWQVALLNETNSAEQNGRLFCNESPIPILHRVFVAAEFKELGEPRLLEAMSPYFRAQQARKIPILCDLGSHLYSAKALFALLTDERYFRYFTVEEVDFIKRHIPWTRRVLPGQTLFQGAKIDLIPYIQSHKELFVLKPSIGYGGFGVVVGKECDGETWSQALLEAREQKQWVVQEALEKPTTLFPRLEGNELELVPFQMVHGPIHINGKLCTNLIRAQPACNSQVINVHQGAELVVSATALDGAPGEL